MKIIKRINKNLVVMKNEGKTEFQKGGDQKNFQGDRGEGGVSGGTVNGGIGKVNLIGEKFSRVKGVYKKDRGKEFKGGKFSEGGIIGLVLVSVLLDNVFF